MHEFEPINRLFSSIDYPSEKSQDASRNLKISTLTDDKTKVEPRLLSSYLASQTCTSQNLSQMNGSMKQATSIAPLAVRDENRPPLRKTKFDLNCLAGSNSFKQSIVREAPNGSSVQNNRPAKNSTIKGKMIRQNRHNSINFEKSLHKDEIESIIFDSKAVKTQCFSSKAVEQMMKAFAESSEKQVQKFRHKIAQVNGGIDAGINNVGKMIKQLRLLSLEKKIKAKEEKCKNMMDSQLFQSIISEKVILQRQGQSSQTQQQENLINEKGLQKHHANEKDPSQSKVELVGNFQTQKAALSQQFTVFVNRLSRQIQLDIEFTQMAAELHRNNSLGSAKSIIINEFNNKSSKLNQSFLEMDPYELDPLEAKPSSFIQLTPTDLKVESQKLIGKLQDIQVHFNSKLRKAFSPSIISMLFQELSANSGSRQKDTVTVGDLLSYINMRTNTSFRNRFFVKMMKRLNLKPSGPITPPSLQLFTK